MKRAALLVILCLAAPALFAETFFYRSDWVGLAMEPIDQFRRDEFDYVLKVVKEPWREVRTLYNKGKEWKRWETAWNEQREKTEEREFEDHRLTLHATFDRRGRLKTEDRYEKGVLKEKRLYSYSSRGVDFVDTLDAQDFRLYTDEYDLAPSGRLRSVRRVYPDGSVAVIHYTYGDRLLMGEWEYRDGRILETIYNENGQIVRIEEREKDVLLTLKERHYNKDSGRLEKETEKNIADKTAAERRYDPDGSLTTEVVSEEGGGTVEYAYVYDGAKKKSVRKKSDIGVEEWKYFYGADDKIEREEYYRRGFLEMRTVYKNDESWYEEILREEQVIIRIHYFKEKKIREEFLQDGQVVRVKEY